MLPSLFLLPFSLIAPSLHFLLTLTIRSFSPSYAFSSTSHLSLTCNYTPSFLSTSKSHPFSRIISFSLPKDTMAHQ
jgi:hypothetical protein